MARNPSNSDLRSMRDLLRWESDSSEHGDEATRLLDRLSMAWIDSPQTPGEKAARKNVYAEAVHFVYQHDLR